MSSQPHQRFDRRSTTINTRRRAFWTTAAVVLVGLALMITLRDDEQTTAVTDETTSLPAPPPPPSTDGLVADQVPPAAQSAAEAFADDYVGFSYGLVEPDEIAGATPELVARLERDDPRVPPAQAEAAAGAKVTAVDVSLITATMVDATAAIEAGETAYEITLDLRKNGGRWLVTDVSALG